MGLLDGIQRLINEHGSSVILKERIALANDKYSALEQKLSASEIREHDLASENERLRLDLEKAHVQINQLQERIDGHETLQLKFGVYWDKDGNPYCPKCKTPTSNVAWATYINRQVQALKCPCSPKPFVLMENGEPIQAPDAMKKMASAWRSTWTFKTLRVLPAG